VAAELGGVLGAIDRALLLQACRLLIRSQRVKDADAAIRMSSEARRIMSSLQKRAPPPAPHDRLAEYLRTREHTPAGEPDEDSV
jgi:hypothetical protein